MLGELDRVGAAVPLEALAAGVSELLKRLALEHFDARAVAALTGADWLGFLDRTGGNGRFADGPGRVLAEGPYASSPVVDKRALLALAGDWIRSNAR